MECQEQKWAAYQSFQSLLCAKYAVKTSVTSEILYTLVCWLFLLLENHNLQGSFLQPCHLAWVGKVVALVQPARLNRKILFCMASKNSKPPYMQGRIYCLATEQNNHII